VSNPEVFSVLLAIFLSVDPVVPTAQYDNQRTGANLNETVLTPRTVASKQFGALFSFSVDGDVYAQPLYVPSLDIPGKGRHNVVFLVTSHDSVYAFDAAAHPAEPLWRTSFINPAAGINPARAQDVHCNFIAPEVGITPTPVIDPVARVIYVLVRTSEGSRGGDPLLYQRLHALDLATGAEKPGSPVLIRASVKSSTFFGLLPKQVDFHSVLENPRAAMLLSGGQVYIAWGSACDVGPYHGWVLSYDASTLRQTGVFNTSPDSGESGIWQSDAGIAADRDGAVYAVTGNGVFDASSGGRDFGDSVIKLAVQNGELSIRDYFTPFDQDYLNRTDKDLGASSPILLPDQPGAHPHLLITGGKTGLMYLIDRDRMGKFQAGSNSHAVQTIQTGTGTFGAPAFWNGHLYTANRKDVLKDFALEQGRLTQVPVHQGKFTFPHPGAIPSISANGTRDGIVWTVYSDGPRDRGSAQADSEAVFIASDAADVSRQLYFERLDHGLRFTMPLVAAGRVYIPARGKIYVYGLR
jgi:hypothetical protein